MTRVLFGAFGGQDGVDSSVVVRAISDNEVIAESDMSTYNWTVISSLDDIARVHAYEIGNFVAGRRKE